MRFLNPDSTQLSEMEKLWIYNAGDVAVTLEVLDELLPQLDAVTGKTYDLERALQGPVLSMMMDGTLVDRYRRAEVREQLKTKWDLLKDQLNQIIVEGLGGEAINPNSYDQVAAVLYDILRVPPVLNREGKRTVDEKALVKLRKYFYAQPICNYILELRDTLGKLKTLNAKPDPDGRMRVSLSIAGTNTGRFASYGNAFGRGMNNQNVTAEMRPIFIADPGKKFLNVDLQQVQSRLVGACIWNRLHDSVYLDACESGDLHTKVSRMTWTHLPWTGDDALDRVIAKRNKLYGEYSLRDGAKPLGHGTNFWGQPRTLSEETGIPLTIVKEFQLRYLSAFPAIPLWWEDTRELLKTDGFLISLTGRKRWFHDRLWEDQTLREALAYMPQADESFLLNTGLLKVWRANLPTVQLLQQGHDSALIQFSEEREHELVPLILGIMLTPIPLKHDRTLTVPLEALVGWNWGYHDAVGNPDGIKTYVEGGDGRQRTRTPATGLLD